jgi:mRNA-degrading endonuclease YafQ of YafQ-DinJ toxin-antitoxin module
MPEYRTLVFTSEFMESYGNRDFSYADRRRFQRALLLLDANERHPSLRVHELSGELAGWWSASASDVLRITFQRLPDSRKRLGVCSRHYDR